MGSLRLVGLSFVVIAGLVAACGKSEPTALDRAKEEIKRLDELKLLREAEDKRNAPFDSSLVVGRLTAEQKKELCGDDYMRIAIGWPIKKALACAGQDLYVASEAAGGVRIWQHCDSTGQCLTVGERDGYVASWNR